MGKFIKYMVKSLLIGISFLLAVNLIGQFFNFNIPINLLSISLIGFFHVPGLIVLLILLLL